ncbi:MAG: hypothetical protein U0794_01755 [Isosphaeraceae bacterium]
MSLPRPGFTLRRMMAAVGLLAVGLAQPRVTTLVVVLAVALLAVRRLWTRPRGDRSRAWAVPYFVTLVCLYLPFAWVLGDYPWDSYRRQWIGFWPVLPGLIAGMVGHPNDEMMFALSGALTLVLLAAFTALGSRGRAFLVVANGVLLIAAAFESWVAYQLFLF